MDAGFYCTGKHGTTMYIHVHCTCNELVKFVERPCTTCSVYLLFVPQ